MKKSGFFFVCVLGWVGVASPAFAKTTGAIKEPTKVVTDSRIGENPADKVGCPCLSDTIDKASGDSVAPAGQKKPDSKGAQ